MAGNITYTMIKPGAVKRGKIGPILSIINQSGFQVIAMKLMQLTHQQAAEFYLIHKDRPFYNDLVNFMSSGPIVAAILQKENAVEDYRKLIGATNPEQAAEGTIRKLFAESTQKNAVHGSDSDESAIIESNFIFSKTEQFQY